MHLTGVPRWLKLTILVSLVAIGISCTVLLRGCVSSPPTGMSPGPVFSRVVTDPPASSPQDAPPSPTEGSIPSGDDEHGCPRGNDASAIVSSNPYCKRKKARDTYQRYYAHNPAYKCADGRNNGLNERNIDQFIPCINSALRLELNGGTMVLYSSTTPQVKLQPLIVLGGREDYIPNMVDSGTDWLIRQTVTAAEATTFRIKWFSNPDLQHFWTYMRTGSGKWRLLATPADVTFSSDTYYQVVVFWNDPRKPAGDAPLPPGFRWREVPKHIP